MFGDVGLHQGSVDRITREAGCSRATFYQYFADKDDLLRHLAGELTIQLTDAVAGLGPITADGPGWATLRDLIRRWRRIHDRYQAVFHTFPALFESDPTFATGATRVRADLAASVAGRVEASTLAPDRVEGVVDLLLVTLPRAFLDLDALRRAAPDSYPPEATLDVLADVAHRALFGLDHSVNVHDHELPPPPRLAFGPLVRSGLDRPSGDDRDDRDTRAALLAAARACFVRLGFHATRVDTIADEAGVSHGTLYTYFDGKDHVAQVLALEAMRGAAESLQQLPTPEPGRSGREALQRWLAGYNRAQAGASAMILVWSEALRAGGDPAAESAPPLDMGPRPGAHQLTSRGFGDVELDAAVFLAFLALLGARERTPATLDLAAELVDRAFFGGLDTD